MSIADLMAWLQVSRGTVYKLLGEGLPHYRLGDRRFDKESVRAWLEARKVGVS